jgi:ectoine hydroxylase-related dioxygenase (phytanoyl-CoA dioxygenase family)
MKATPHAWSRDFHWQPAKGPFRRISAAQARSWDEQGFFVLEDAFDAGTLERVDAELASGDAKVKEFLAHAPDGRFSVAGLDTQTVAPHAVARSEYLRDFVAGEVLAGVARDLIGPDVRLYWDQSVYKQPNSAAPVLWHQDNGYTYVEPQAYLTCWIAITDAHHDNGCIAVMPRVHRDGTLVHRTTPVGEECWGEWSESVEVPVRAGSIVVFTSLTPHATERNTTGEVRKAYIVQYAPDGAVAHHGDATAGPPTKTEKLGDDTRRFRVVREGAPVGPPPLPTRR